MVIEHFDLRADEISSYCRLKNLSDGLYHPASTRTYGDKNKTKAAEQILIDGLKRFYYYCEPQESKEVKERLEKKEEKKFTQDVFFI